MCSKLLAKSIGLCCLCLLQNNVTKAQNQYNLPQPDTLSVNVQQAEKMFLDKNLSLLAQHYNIQSNEELVVQAKKWDNPVLNTDQNVYANNQFFQHTVDANGNGQGEIYVQVQQLIKTAGKRGKQIDLAKTNVNLAEWQFKSVMRSLRASLLQDFYTIAQLEDVGRLYDDNMAQLTQLQKGQAEEYKAGDIAQKEYLRVQALIVSLQQNITDNDKAINDAESELKTILQVTGNTFVKPVISDSEDANLPDISLFQLVDTAKRNNTDYQQEVYQLQYQQQNYSLQRALAAPDVTVGPEFDQNANYAPNYVGLSISLPLPLWDRNQGNIRSARYQEKEEEANMQQVDQKLQNDVMNAYQKLMYTAKLSSETNTQFYKDYYKLQQNVVKSYNTREIGLIEFLDYFNDYQTIRQQQLQQILDLRLAKENLNDVVGIDVVN
jgi:outer membrane protein, heavy metal efflux system